MLGAVVVVLMFVCKLLLFFVDMSDAVGLAALPCFAAQCFRTLHGTVLSRAAACGGVVFSHAS